MRTDDGTARKSFRNSKEWTHNATTGKSSEETDTRMIEGDEIAQGNMEVHSLSGKERNHLFLNHRAGASFSNVSAISGVDSVSDGRGFVYLDYDRDGFQDIAVVNANSPLVQLYHNDIAKISSQKNGMIALRFVGGNTKNLSSELTNRDGYGAIVEVGLKNGTVIEREHLCGSGFAAQNSATMIIGVGGDKDVQSVKVRWPSGRTTETQGVPEGTLLTAFEKRPEGDFTREQYRIEAKEVPKESQRYQLPFAGRTPGKIQVYTTMATWCPACANHLPALSFLKKDDIALFGVPVDVNDTSELLAEYVRDKGPAYSMLADLTTDDREKVVGFLGGVLRTKSPALPSTIIADGEGKVLEVMQGVPNLSQVRRWMFESE